MYIYAGKPSERYRATLGGSDRIQLADKMASPADIKTSLSLGKEHNVTLMTRNILLLP